MGTRGPLLKRWPLKPCSQRLRKQPLQSVIREVTLGWESEDGWESGKPWGTGRALGVGVGQDGSLQPFLSFPRDSSSLAGLPAASVLTCVYSSHSSQREILKHVDQTGSRGSLCVPRKTILTCSGLDCRPAPISSPTHPATFSAPWDCWPSCCLLENNRLAPVSRHLHLLFSLPGMLSLQISHGSLVLPIRSLLQ